VQFPITDNTFASLSLDARELFGRCADWAMDLLVPPPSGVTLTGADYNGATFELTGTGFDPSTRYQLHRTLDGSVFTDVGLPFTPASATHTATDPAPPAATTALYQFFTLPLP
jgi:hypothetical protein